jgi:hypothetical protein
MPADRQDEGLIISGNTTPLIRVGYSNIIFFLLPVWSILINQALRDLGAAPLIRGTVLLALCVAALKVYSHAVSRIAIRDGRTLVLVGPFAETEIDAADILKADVFGFSSCMTIVLEIRRKTASLPMYYYFVAVVTNYGAHAETRAELLSLLRQLE